MGTARVLLLSALLAFCSFNYELVFAQVLSMNFGASKWQYFTTFGLFTLALGLGALAHGRLRVRFADHQLLLAAEATLVILGVLGPLVMTALLGHLPVRLGLGLSYGLVVVVGVASGFELLCLFAFAPGRIERILAADYAGMLAATLAFPLLLLPALGVAGASIFTVLVNLLALIVLLAPPPRVRWTGLLAVSALAGLLFVASEELNVFFGALYLGAP